VTSTTLYFQRARSSLSGRSISGKADEPENKDTRKTVLVLLYASSKSSRLWQFLLTLFVTNLR